MFLSLFKNFDFLGPQGHRRAKNSPEWEKILSVALHISGTMHHMIVIMVQICKVMISLSIFFFLILKFWFSRRSGGWKGKKWPKMTKISVYHTLYFRGHISHDLHLWYTCIYKMIISAGIFFIFLSKFWFLGTLRRGC